MHHRNIIKPICLAIAFAVVFGCFGSDEGLGQHEDINFPVTRDITFTAFNNGPDNIHIYEMTQSRNNGNRLIPGQVEVFSTIKTYTWQDENDFVNVNIEASSNVTPAVNKTIVFTAKDLEAHRLISARWNGTTLTLEK